MTNINHQNIILNVDDLRFVVSNDDVTSIKWLSQMDPNGREKIREVYTCPFTFGFSPFLGTMYTFLPARKVCFSHSHTWPYKVWLLYTLAMLTNFTKKDSSESLGFYEKKDPRWN